VKVRVSHDPAAGHRQCLRVVTPISPLASRIAWGLLAGAVVGVVLHLDADGRAGGIDGDQELMRARPVDVMPTDPASVVVVSFAAVSCASNAPGVSPAAVREVEGQ
jgi:hypothetical protein